MTSAAPQKDAFEDSADDVLDGLPCGIISTRPDGTIIRVNETFVGWTGQSREALLAGQRFQDLLTVPARIFYETHFAPLLRIQGFVREIACQLKRAGQNPLHVLVNSNLKLNSDGEPLVIRTALFDATDRAKYEQELRHSRSAAQQLAAIVTSSSDAIVSVGLDTVVRSWNPGATRLFGYPEAEAVDRTIDELIVPEGRRAEQIQKYETIRSGQQVVFSDTVRRRKDGSLVPVEISGSPILDGDGRVSAVSLIFRDIGERNQAETALRETEHFLRQITDIMPGVLQVFDLAEKRSVFINRPVASLLGFTTEEVQAMGTEVVPCLMHPDDLPRFEQHLARVRALADGTVAEFEHRMRDRAGKWHWFQSHDAVFARDATGASRQLIGMAVEITDHKAASAALRHNEQLHRVAFDLAPVGMVYVGPDKRFMRVNARMCEISGYTEDELLRMKVGDLTHPDDLVRDTALLDVFLGAGTLMYVNEKRYVRKDGAIRWVAVTANMVTDDAGQPLHSIFVIRDIQDRKLAEMQLRESEVKLRLGIRVAGIGLGAMDYRAGTIVLDETAATLFALPANRPLSRDEVHARFHPDDAPTILEKIADSLNPAGDGVLAHDHRILRPDGSIAWVSARKQVEFSIAPDGAKRAATGLLALLDITERRLAEIAILEREERLRLVIDGSLAFIGVMEPDGTLVEANAPALIAGGLTRPDVLGRKLWDTYWFSYEQGVVDQIQNACARAREGEIVREDVVTRTRGDTRMTMDFMLAPVRDDEGRVRLLVPSGFDITERKRAETAVRLSHDTYLNLIKTNPFGVYLIDADFRIAQISTGAQKVFGNIVPLIGRDFEEVIKVIWLEPFASEVIDRFRHTLETGEPYHSADTTEKRADLGAEETYDWQIERVPLPDGRFGVVCYFYDMTERKRYEQQIRFLMGEVNHRAKNLLAVVQAIAGQTAREGDPATFTKRLSERIQGLAAGHDLLVRNQWEGVEVSELVRAQLAHFAEVIDTRVLMHGPAFLLSPGAAQGVGMALHEMATNAAKYGALSNTDGRIRISWDRIEEPQPLFTMQWIEEGGPEVTPPSRIGFGHRVITRMVEAAVDGKVEIEYRKRGFSWSLSAPLSNQKEASGLGT